MTRAQLLAQKIINPVTQNKVSVRYALMLPKSHLAYKAAQALLAQHTKDKPKKAPVATPRKATLDVSPEARAVVEKHVSNPVRRDILQEYGDEHLNGVSPIDIAASYLSLIWDEDPDGILKLNVYQQSDTRISIEIKLANGSSITRGIRTSRKTGANIIYNEYFELGRNVPKGGGLAKKMLRQTIDLADKINAKAVMFHAGLSAGGYVWAKYGGIPTPSSRIEMYSSINSKLENLPLYVSQIIATRQENIRYYEKRIIELQDEFPDDAAAYAEIAMRQLQGIEELERTLEIANKNKPQLDVLKKMFEKGTEPLQTYFKNGVAYVPSFLTYRVGKQLPTDLLQYVAHSPFGKLLLMETEWWGYFNMRKGSLGRNMLEHAVR